MNINEKRFNDTLSATSMPPCPSEDTRTCCTCAGFLIPMEFQSELYLDKLAETSRQFECCGRYICGRCIHSNPRFLKYCPFCQTSTRSSLSFRQLPPSYSPSIPQGHGNVELSSGCSSPPSYKPIASELPVTKVASSKGVIHYLRTTDTILSLSILYKMDPVTIRAANGLFADTLLPARRTVIIPFTKSFPQGSVSMSPNSSDPGVDDSKVRLKRFQLQTKCVDYKMAQWYITQAGGDERKAVETWKDDEAWEKLHPNRTKSFASPSRYER